LFKSNSGVSFDSCSIFFILSLFFHTQARHKPPRGAAGGEGVLVKRAEMPSLQTALPPELANNVIRLYRECLRRAKFVGHRQHNTELIVDMVRQQFKKNMHETDPEKIQKMKDEAARGLINHMLYEHERMSGQKLSQSS
uniref:Complex 1 LYR protein domain-containing protein n=4 Tax=Magnoliopsida TaxID=3398 RepID=A0A9I9CPS4_CUCME